MEQINTQCEFWLRTYNQYQHLHITYAFSLEIEIMEIIYDITEITNSKIKCLEPPYSVKKYDYVIFYLEGKRQFGIIKNIEYSSSETILTLGFHADCLPLDVFIGEPKLSNTSTVKSLIESSIINAFTDEHNPMYNLLYTYDVSQIPTTYTIGSVVSPDGVLDFTTFTNQMCRFMKLRLRIDFIDGIFTIKFYKVDDAPIMIDIYEKDLILEEPEVTPDDDSPTKLKIIGYNEETKEYVYNTYYLNYDGSIKKTTDLPNSLIVPETIYDSKSITDEEAYSVAIGKIKRSFNNNITIKISKNFFGNKDFFDLLNYDVIYIDRDREQITSNLTRIALSGDGEYEIILGNQRKRLTSKIKKLKTKGA